MRPVQVLDISHHNDGPSGGAIDFAAIREFGVVGIIHKSSQGSGNLDRRYPQRRQAALDAGLLWGAYHFADASNVKAQLDHFLDAAEPDETTLMALDFEPNGNNTMTLPSARAFMRGLDARTGRSSVLYSGNLIKETLGNQPDEFLGSHRLWLAQYGPVARIPKAWSKYWLWQFSGDGVSNPGITIPGVLKSEAQSLDMNTYNGTDAQLAAEWAGDPVEAPVVS